MDTNLRMYIECVFCVFVRYGRGERIGGEEMEISVGQAEIIP